MSVFKRLSEAVFPPKWYCNCKREDWRCGCFSSGGGSIFVAVDHSWAEETCGGCKQTRPSGIGNPAHPLSDQSCPRCGMARPMEPQASGATSPFANPILPASFVVLGVAAGLSLLLWVHAPVWVKVALVTVTAVYTVSALVLRNGTTLSIFAFNALLFPVWQFGVVGDWWVKLLASIVLVPLLVYSAVMVVMSMRGLGSFYVFEPTRLMRFQNRQAAVLWGIQVVGVLTSWFVYLALGSGDVKAFMAGFGQPQGQG